MFFHAVLRNEPLIMLSPAVLFAVVTTGFQILLVYSNPAHEIDFRTILELAQKQALQKEAKEDYNSHYGSLTSREILDLIQQSTQNQGIAAYGDYSRPANKKRKDSETYGHYNRYTDLNENKIDEDYQYESDGQRRNKYKDDEERYKHNRFNELALEELLNQNVLDKQYQDRPRKRVTPNNLVGSYGLSNVKSDNSGSDYSKVYVILNPQAIEKSKNKDELNSLLVKILSLTASSLGREQGKRIKEHRYKGFPVKAGLLTRRARRDSRENGDDEEYKPKRPRNDRGSGGGGGGGGRTAIPYIRHRGDIYERDN